MTDERGVARTIWEIGVLVRGDTSGGRLALERATAIHPTLEGIGESRLVRAAVTGAREGGTTRREDVPFRPAGIEGVDWPDRLAWIAKVPARDVLSAFADDGTTSAPRLISPAPPDGCEEARRELSRLWESHGARACDEALAGATRRSRWLSLGALVALALFIGAMIFVVHDLMQNARREREYESQADLYSVPGEAVESPQSP